MRFKEILQKMSKPQLSLDDDGFIYSGSADEYKTFADLDVNDADIDEREANKEAVVIAINSTYGKGIDPTAAPELLEACKRAKDYLYTKYPIEADIFNELETVIKKAQP